MLVFGLSNNSNWPIEQRLMLYIACVMGASLLFSVWQMQNQYQKSAKDRIKWNKVLNIFWVHKPRDNCYFI